MSPELQQKVRRILDEAMALPPAKRERFLDFSCLGEPVVRNEVARLMAETGPASPDAADAGHPGKIGRYEIRGELGSGAMGKVYEAFDPAIGRVVALKVLNPPVTGDPAEAKSLEDRLFREATSAGRLSHPNIVTVFDVGKEGDLSFIAMERVEGPTLQRLIDERSLDRGQILDILCQCAAALDFAHSEGIVHRDVKPPNIMLHRGSQVKIADFGIAKVDSMSQLTAAGTVLGTPRYMSPEQIRGSALTGKSDQFSLAVVAFELLTGKRPFERDSLNALLLAIVDGQRPKASVADPTLPPLADEVFRVALDSAPVGRFATCSAFVNALYSSLGMERAQPSGVGTGVQTKTQAPAGNLREIAAPPPPPPPSSPPPPLPSAAGFTPVLPPPPRIPRSRRRLPWVVGALAVALLTAAWPLYRYIFPAPISNARQPEAAGRVASNGPETAGAPVVSLFVAEPDKVPPGGSATLRWWVTGAAEVVINQEIGKVASKGSIEVKPRKATEYLLTANSPGGSVSAKVLVNTGSAAPPVQPATNPRDLPSPATAAPPPAIPPSKPVAETPVSDPRRAGQLYDEAISKRRAGSPAAAVPLLRQSAALGEPRAMVDLGRMFAAGDGVAKDFSEAARLYRKSAGLGNPSAMVYLAALYAQGAGVPKDLAETAKWLRKAADSGDGVAMDGLGQMYFTGKGVPADPAQAVAWYRKAIETGNAPAMFHLAEILESGSGSAGKDQAEADRLYRRAADAGYAPAKAKLRTP